MTVQGLERFGPLLLQSAARRGILIPEVLHRGDEATLLGIEERFSSPLAGS